MDVGGPGLWSRDYFLHFIVWFGAFCGAFWRGQYTSVHQLELKWRPLHHLVYNIIFSVDNNMINVALMGSFFNPVMEQMHEHFTGILLAVLCKIMDNAVLLSDVWLFICYTR